MEYSEKVMEHFAHPHNVGVLEDANGVGEVGNAKCGDIMRMYVAAPLGAAPIAGVVIGDPLALVVVSDSGLYRLFRRDGLAALLYASRGLTSLR